MSVWDWIIVFVPLIVVFWIGIKAQSYISGVSDFLAAGRCAGRYVICVADGSAGMGLISVVAICEMKYQAGWGLDFWSNFVVLAALFLTLTGFVTYRYRETRAMTMAQFFEMRYSRRFRILAGFLAFVSGLFNYALFPAVGGRFIMYYCQLPDFFHVMGVKISMYGFLMALFLGLALFIVLLGGQLTTMVTDCVQGIIGYFIYAAIVGAIFYCFTISDMEQAALLRPEGQSFFNPFNIDKLTSFNVLFILITLFATVYNRNSWLGQQGYMCAAISPHEQKMAGVLGQWKGGFQAFMLMVIVMAVYAFMQNKGFADQSAAVTAELAERINSSTFDSQGTVDTIRNQMLVPVALRHILPAGMVGLFCALMLFLMISTDTTYMHSWGSILVQDVILPIRNKPISPKAQMLLLRCSIAGIAVFAWFFSFYFGQVDFILMFFAMTGTVFLAGSGSAIIGGLYWKKGTTAGAYTAMVVGALLGVGGFLLEQNWEKAIYPFLVQYYSSPLETFRVGLGALGDMLPIADWNVAPEAFCKKFPISGQEIYMLAMLVALGCYIVVSLLTCRKAFNLEKMLHRGCYADAEEQRMEAAFEQLDGAETPVREAAPARRESLARRWLNLMLGITPEYTKGDRILAWSVFLWVMWGFAIFLFQLCANVFFDRWTEQTWFNWWKYYTLPLTVLYGVVTSVWFIIGGISDLRKMFKILSSVRRSSSDNGMVTEKEDGE